MQPEVDWRQRGAADCYQDRCENAPFGSVGGLERRANLHAPRWAMGHEAEYLEGYEAQAKEMFGEDWRTCEFAWNGPVLVIDPQQKKTRQP